MDTGQELEKKQNHFVASFNPEEVMANLKALRKNYHKEVETMAKTANFDSKVSHFSRVLQVEDEEELQFLRDERAAIREYDAGMSKSRAEYLSVLDVPCLPFNSNKKT